MAEEITSGRRQKLRDSFVAGDATAHTDEAILELLLNYAIHKGNLQPLANNLIKEFGDLDGVLAADFETLCKLNGVKSYTSTLIKLAGYLRGQRTVEIPLTKATTKSAQQKLVEYEPSGELKAETQTQITRAVPGKGFIKPRSEIFTNAVLKEAIDILPRLPETEDIDDIRQFLKENLPFSAENTRKKYVPYITEPDLSKWSGRSCNALLCKDLCRTSGAPRYLLLQILQSRAINAGYQ